ncbi:hypothetical protein L2719_05415 [Shewanella schlegeliana]|uniref:Lipoprotein n=1 Tax=Shewanella schlegeliana TaxID=190308 RepID=A0ABS1SZE4_9GAMM|nr:hypothetical protein [Shewanella schlegeliana]MBL4912917.1 hypothetical protein [Shewanella schlegeliana]MCL1108987.1 hypothetical protein [Shewanella schlegeliana]GIU23436.1 hypothetical protein TUM4433_05880 [Shewanella schlegeliana]
MKILMITASIATAILLSACSSKTSSIECDTFERCYLLTLFSAQQSVLSHTEFSELKVVIAVDYDSEQSNQVQTKVKESSGFAEFDAFAKRE